MGSQTVAEKSASARSRDS